MSLLALVALVALAALLIVAPLPARADDDAEHGERLALARSILRANGFEHAYSENISTMTESLVRVVEQATGKPHDEAARVTTAIVLPALRAHVGELTDAVAEVYAQRLTLEDLHQVLAFYQSPPGRKVAEAYPDMMTRMTTVQQQWYRRVTQQALQALAETPPDGGKKM